jgi:hypothetical protein
MYPSEFETLTSHVSRVMKIDDVTRGGTKDNYIVRYRGQLISDDSAAAYDQLATALRPLDITPLFRGEKGKHVILLLSGVIQPNPSRVWVNIVLFILTLISVFLAGVYYTLGGVYDGPANPGFQDLLPFVRESIGGGLAFTASLLAILLAHEFGHYLAG